ncbi:transposase [Salinimonas lutimaris]|uniref:transposase n=1 Tax=Salinimonas lutimaris TaxID=914153 RepID=UPI0038CD3856
MEDRIARLASVFAVKVCAYAVMHNHTHLVLYVDNKHTEEWDLDEVIRRWHKLFKGTCLSRKYMQNSFAVSNSPAEIKTLRETVNIWRNRLQDISWFMRSLNEYIARKANEEDGCTGRFWEGRFKMQALLDEAALLACMVYVDLNPMRAGLSVSPEASSYTSFKKRFCSKKTETPILWLLTFCKSDNPGKRGVLPCSHSDYFALVQHTAKNINNRQSSTEGKNELHEALSINTSFWPEVTQNFEHCFHHAAGAIDTLTSYVRTTGLKRMVDRQSALRLVASA